MQVVPSSLQHNDVNLDVAHQAIVTNDSFCNHTINTEEGVIGAAITLVWGYNENWDTYTLNFSLKAVSSDFASVYTLRSLVVKCHFYQLVLP